MSIAPKPGIVIDFNLTEIFDEKNQQRRLRSEAKYLVPQLKEIVPAFEQALKLTDSSPHIYMDPLHNYIPLQLKGIVGIEDKDVMETISKIAVKFHLLGRGLDCIELKFSNQPQPLQCRHLSLDPT